MQWLLVTCASRERAFMHGRSMWVVGVLTCHDAVLTLLNQQSSEIRQLIPYWASVYYWPLSRFLVAIFCKVTMISTLKTNLRGNIVNIRNHIFFISTLVRILNSQILKLSFEFGQKYQLQLTVHSAAFEIHKCNYRLWMLKWFWAALHMIRSLVSFIKDQSLCISSVNMKKDCCNFHACFSLFPTPS